MLQKASSSYLNFSVDGVKPKLIAKQAVANLIFLHPLVGIVSTLRCTSNNLWDRTKIYLQPLEHVFISCWPSASASAVENIQSGSVGTMSPIPHGRGCHGFLWNTAIFKTQRSSTCTYQGINKYFSWVFTLRNAGILYEKVWDARRELWIKLHKETDLGVA